MRIHVEINSIDELSAIFAIIRGEELDVDKLVAMRDRLKASADVLQTAVDDNP